MTDAEPEPDVGITLMVGNIKAKAFEHLEHGNAEAEGGGQNVFLVDRNFIVVGPPLPPSPGGGRRPHGM